MANRPSWYKPFARVPSPAELHKMAVAWLGGRSLTIPGYVCNKQLVGGRNLFAVELPTSGIGNSGDEDEMSCHPCWGRLVDALSASETPIFL